MRLFIKLVLLILLVPSCAFAEKIKTTIWRPDTCNGCAFEYQWDADDPKKPPVFLRVVETSSEHPGLTGIDLYNVVLEENQRKNKAFNIIKEIIPAFDDKNYKWSFDDKRGLVIEFVDIRVSKARKNKIQDTFDIALGKGKVMVK